MRRLIADLRHLLAELKRRKVYQVAALYCVAAFGVLQLADIILPAFGAEGAIVIVLVLIVAAFPGALLLGWLYEWTATGVRRTPDQSGSHGDPPSRAVRSLAMLAAGAATVLVSVGGWQVVAHRTGNGPGTNPEAPAGGLAGIPAMDPRRIAVLYFDDHSEGGELGYLADALTEAVIHELGQVGTLEVISRNGVKRFRGMDTDLADVVRELRVGSIVEGSVARVGDGVRITFQLIDGRDLAHLHSGTVNGPAGEWLALHDELVGDVARALRQQLGDVVSIQRRRQGNQSDEAWDLVSRASRLRSDFVALRTEDAAAGMRLLNRADSLLARAERLDPDWIEPVLARGYVARHLALAAGAADGTPDSAWIDQALRQADRALALGVDSARALELRGSLRLVAARRLSGPDRARMLDAAESDLRDAVERDRELARAWGWLSELLVEQSRFEEGRLAAQHALEADEFLEQERGTLWAMAYSALQFGPDDDAIHYCDEGRRRFPDISDFIICKLMILASFPQVEPDVAAGWRLADSLALVVPGPVSEQWHTYGVIHVAKIAARSGMPDSARAIARRARGDDTPGWLAYNEAYLNLLLGDTARAIGLLRTALAEEVVDSAVVAREWWFEPLHGRQDFATLLGRHAPEPR